MKNGELPDRLGLRGAILKSFLSNFLNQRWKEIYTHFKKVLKAKTKEDIEKLKILTDFALTFEVLKISGEIRAAEGRFVNLILKKYPRWFIQLLGEDEIFRKKVTQFVELPKYKKLKALQTIRRRLKKSIYQMSAYLQRESTKN